MCPLLVCYIQPIYLSESERKSDGQCEQAVILIKLSLVQDTLRKTETETRQFERQMEEERKSLQRAWQEMERLRHAHPSLKVVYHSLFKTK